MIDFNNLTYIHKLIHTYEYKDAHTKLIITIVSIPMIPISDTEEPIPLSLEEIATLLQTLVDLKNANDSDQLPPAVEIAVDDLMSASKVFVKKIDAFL